MKIKLILTSLVLLSACAELENFTRLDANSTPKEKFRACAVNEATTKLKNGTLFTQDFTTTKNAIVKTCLKKLAYEAAGFDSEASQIADTILSQFRN